MEVERERMNPKQSPSPVCGAPRGVQAHNNDIIT